MKEKNVQLLFTVLIISWLFAYGFLLGAVVLYF